MDNYWIKFRSDSWDNSRKYVLKDKEIFLIKDKNIWCIGDGINPVESCKVLVSLPPVLHIEKDGNKCYILAETKLPTDN